MVNATTHAFGNSKTASLIILDEEQFVPHELLDKAELGQAQYEAIDRALYGPYLLPIDVYYYGTTPITNNVWGRIGGHVFCYPDG